VAATPALKRPALFAVCVIALTAEGAGAQSSLQIPLQFDFLNPGARSLAVGSAFAGLADDATAAFTNPAGLTILSIPEVSFEVRGRRLESPFLSSGRLSGPVTNLGIDTVAGAVYGESVSEGTGVSYLSFVLPRGNWSIAGYRHEFVRLDQEFEATGAFLGLGVRDLAVRARRDVNITTYGAAAAFRVHPKVSLGGGLGAYLFDLDAEFGRFLPMDAAGVNVDPFGRPTFTPQTEVGHAEQHSDTTSIGFNLGGLFTVYESSNPAGAGPNLIQLGVVYRKGASFNFEGFEGSVEAPVQRNGTFRTPDAFAAGAAVRLTDSATAAVEVTWIGYESLADGYISAQAGATDPANFVIEDGIEFHAGFEYLLNVPGFPALRAGLWRDPDHAVRYELPANPTLIDERFAAYLPARGASMHYTFGAGVSLSRRLEANFGADLSSRTRQISASAVIRFAR
jgi:long-chain fatty acid transport protein